MRARNVLHVILRIGVSDEGGLMNVWKLIISGFSRWRRFFFGFCFVIAFLKVRRLSREEAAPLQLIHLGLMMLLRLVAGSCGTALSSLRLMFLKWGTSSYMYAASAGSSVMSCYEMAEAGTDTGEERLVFPRWWTRSFSLRCHVWHKLSA